MVIIENMFLESHIYMGYYSLECTEGKWTFFCFTGRVDVPKQLVIMKDASSISDAVVNDGLKLPLGMYIYMIMNLIADTF